MLRHFHTFFQNDMVDNSLILNAFGVSVTSTKQKFYFYPSQEVWQDRRGSCTKSAGTQDLSSSLLVQKTCPQLPKIAARAQAIPAAF